MKRLEEESEAGVQNPEVAGLVEKIDFVVVVNPVRPTQLHAYHVGELVGTVEGDVELVDIQVRIAVDLGEVVVADSRLAGGRRVVDLVIGSGAVGVGEIEEDARLLAGRQVEADGEGVPRGFIFYRVFDASVVFEMSIQDFYETRSPIHDGYAEQRIRLLL